MLGLRRRSIVRAGRRRRSAGAVGAALLASACGFAAPGSAAAQVSGDTSATGDTLTVGLGGPSPAGALVRSFVLPGWGQLHVGSSGRGLVYLAVHGVDTYMLVKTFRRLSDTRERRDDAISAARDSIEMVALTDTVLQRVLEENPDTLDALAAADPEAARLTRLSSARREQREDWMVWAGFWMVASGIDAFVAAHLADFPAEVDVQPVRRSGESLLQLGLRVPVGRRR